jgi:DNA-binding GntR family transcriptional regulator
MEQAMTLRRRANISEEIADTLRELIIDGQLRDGERINEVHLAERLGVSRTPLREALRRLEGEGAVYSVPRIGYFIRPLSIEEFRQIYPMRALLDPEALRLSGIPPQSRLRELAKLNTQIRNATSNKEVLELDDRWHLTLVADCPNGVLIDLIGQFMRRTRRYELALMREGENVRVTTQDHRRVLRALRDGNLRAACAQLKRNMTSGIEPIERWLERR